MRFASACFGAKFIYGLLHPSKKGKLLAGISGSDAANREALSFHTGIRADDILTTQWTSTNFDPGHYISLDHAGKKIVVAFRGTFHARDTLTDLVATTAPFMGGYAHKGILQAAKRKHALLAPTVLDALAQRPEYGVVVVGHSLGAGVASLFTMLFHEIDPQVPIHCYAFACPCVLSPELAMSALVRRIITTVVVADDVVPRLCYPTMDRLKRAMCAILAQSKYVASRRDTSHYLTTHLVSVATLYSGRSSGPLATPAPAPPSRSPSCSSAPRHPRHRCLCLQRYRTWTSCRQVTFGVMILIFLPFDYLEKHRQCLSHPSTKSCTSLFGNPRRSSAHKQRVRDGD